MKSLKFDFNNLLSVNIGAKSGITAAHLDSVRAAARKAARHINDILSSDENRINLGLEWARLPFQNRNLIKRIQDFGDGIAGKYENVISLGIGGSYLGLKAAQDALKTAYYNEFKSARAGRPRVYFDGNNIDPDTLGVLLRNLSPKKTFVIVISKSGETTETKAAFAVVERWLAKGAGPRYGRQIFAITDPKAGSLRKRVNSEQLKDPLSFNNLPVLKGVGGRFSEFNIGLLLLAISGVKIENVLAGASSMAKRCRSAELYDNPALMYAAAHTMLYKKKGKSIAVLMPFSERLKSTADWYVQLLAESLGKKYARLVKRSGCREEWIQDRRKVLNIGRTPVSARGTSDLHSIQQNNIEGEDNKVVTFIKVGGFERDIRVRGTGDFLEGQSYSRLLSTAEEATEWALAKEGRPSCTISMPEISPYYWGGLIFFFEMATAYEGEFLGVNAFDQPGVEGYKNYMYYKLGKPGIAKRIADEIRHSPLRKSEKYII